MSILNFANKTLRCFKNDDNKTNGEGAVRLPELYDLQSKETTFYNFKKRQ